ncbi:hypothetical protein VTK26DRAFT_2693 [Humicola hyalothermophila]
MDMDTDSAASGPAPSTPTATMKLSEPRRRNRPALSCIQCRTRKIRCDRNEPCASCMKSKIVNCTYEEARRPKPRLWRLSPAPAAGHPEPSPTSTDERLAVGSTFSVREAPGPHQPPTSNAPGPGSAAPAPGRTPEPLAGPSPVMHMYHLVSGPGSASPGSTAALTERIRQLEQQLADALKGSDRAASSRSTYPGSSLDHATPSKPSEPRFLTNGDRLFPLLVDVARRIESDKNSDVFLLLQKCRTLSRTIRLKRVPTHAPDQVGKTVPPEETARRLVDGYFRTFESVYRILHRPSFWQGYRKYWENPGSANLAFVVQLQLCMAIGSCFQDDAAVLRRSVAQWVYEAQIWLALLRGNQRANIAILQTMCLLHLAKEICGVEGDASWISAGSLLRTAMYLGLHRDPDHLPNLSVFNAEMRRRLWATILEIVLQSSLDSGAPPLLALSDFDTRPPSNYDDDQLSENGELQPMPPRPPSVFTQTTIQIALLRSYPLRLAITQYANHFNSSITYQETLKWNTELTNACRALSATFQPFYDPAGILPKRLSLFQLRLAESMVHRFVLALNHPWLCLAHNNPAYYFARKMCVDTSLKLYRAIATGSPAGDSGTASPTDDFMRLATCGYGALRSVLNLAVLTLCLELLWQVQEDRSFRQGMSIDHPTERSGPSAETDLNSSVGMGVSSGAASVHELLEAVKYSIGWTERRIQSGETNIKGHLLYSAVLSQVQALQCGASDAEVERQVLNSVAEDLNRCWHLLKDAAHGDTAMAAVDGGATNGMQTSTGLDGAGSESDWNVPETRGFNSIFDLHDAEFFLGS